MPVIYEKTATGRQALTTRQPPLSRSVRNLLLLIDGVKSDQDLIALLSSQDPPADAFEQLKQLGLIAVRSEESSAPAEALAPALAESATAPAMTPDGTARPLSPLARLGQGLRAVLPPREESPREVAAGLAEAVKCAAVADAVFFAWMEANVDALRAREPEAVAHTIQRIPELRASVEAQDRIERRSPSPLDFGMALGRVIESILGYGHYLHGEATGLGMWLAAAIGQSEGVQSQASAQRLRDILRRCGLPTRLPQVAASRWLELLPVNAADPGAHIQFVLLEDIGKPVARIVPRTVVIAALDRAGALTAG